MKLHIDMLKALIPMMLLAVSCNGRHNNIFTELNGIENVSSTSGIEDFETQWFQYPDSTYLKLENLCVVKYYVSGDTLFTSEKYHFLTLGYSWDEDSTLAYQHMIFFDKSQQSDSNGWYHIVIDKNNIPREPATHISSIALRSYLGDKYDYRNKPHADAHLYNATKEIVAGRERITLSPQLQKLYSIIK